MKNMEEAYHFLFKTLCEKTSFIEYAAFSSNVINTANLKIKINGQMYSLTLIYSLSTNRYSILKFNNVDKLSGYIHTNELMNSFFIEHNIKELEFYNFIKRVPFVNESSSYFFNRENIR